MPALRRCLSMTLPLILLLAGPCTANPAQGPKYHIIDKTTTSMELLAPYLHPLLKQKEGNERLLVLSVPEEDILKVAFCANSGTGKIRPQQILCFSNPDRRSFAGMAAAAMNGDRFGVRFEDGTILYASDAPPADAYDAGEVSMKGRAYLIRWRRVYGNYYFVTKFTRHGWIDAEFLMTEENGKDLSPLLGDSSAEPHPEFTMTPTWGLFGLTRRRSQYLEYTDRNGKRIRYTIKKLQEKDLPPDFPKGLVRRIP